MHFIPHFRLTWFKKTFALDQEQFPQAAQRADETISLPLWCGMDDECERVIDAVVKIGQSYARTR